MKKNIFEEAYRGIQEAKKAYDAATDKAGKDAARAMYKKVMAPLEEIAGEDTTGIYSTLWRAYETSKDCGNEYLDISDNITDKLVEGLVACMREYGFTEFTFSSGWSSAVETAWLFQKEGCTLADLIEINGQHKDYRTKEYEKARGYLFKLN